MLRTLLPFLASAALASTPVVAQDSLIVIGDGTSSIGSTPQVGATCVPPTYGTTYTAANDAPFQLALCALKNAAAGGENGGTIEVQTGAYLINNTITVDTPGVTIRGSRGARLVAGSCLSGPMFDVTSASAGFTLEGLSIEDDRNIASLSYTIRVKADRLTVRGCDIALGNGVCCTQPCVLPMGTAYGLWLLPPSEVSLTGALIEGNSFRFRNDPVGIVAIRSENGRALRINDNEFRGEGLSPGQPIDAVIQLVDERWTTISDNVFALFETLQTDPLAHGAIVSRQSVPGPTGDEAGHVAITGNYFEAIKVGAVISLRGHGFSAITGNVLGKINGSPLGAIRLQAGTGNSVSANEFHNVAGTDERVIWLIEEQTPLVQGNSFTLVVSAQNELVLCEGVYGPSILSNQFVAHATSTMPCAIRLKNTGGGTVTKKAFVCANAFRSPIGGSAGFSAQWCDDSAQGVTDCRVSNGNPIFTP